MAHNFYKWHEESVKRPVVIKLNENLNLKFKTEKKKFIVSLHLIYIQKEELNNWPFRMI